VPDRAHRRALYIGRFQPFHLGHLSVIQSVSREFEAVLVGIGSAQESHTLDNPFTAGERHLMIQKSLDAAGIRNYFVIPLPDVGRNALWVSHVQAMVPPFSVFVSNNALPRRLFQEAGFQVRGAPFFEREKHRATAIRQMMLDGKGWQDLVPKQVVEVVEEVHGVERMRDLAQRDDEA
jgi:nicotinamide-nucleotide adenylyltransferase